MKIRVYPHYIEIAKEKQIINKGEYKINKCYFEFSEEYTSDLVKVALFTNSLGTYKEIINNNECDIPSEMTSINEVCLLGVYAYKLENEELILRYSPSPKRFSVEEGSYNPDAENSQPITPSEMEQYEQELQDGLNRLDEAVGNAEVNSEYAKSMGDYAKEQGDNAKDLIDNYSATLNAMQNDIATNTSNISANTTSINNLSNRVSTNETNIQTINNNLSNYSLISETGSQLVLNLDSTNYKIKALLKDKNGNTIYTSNEIDLPLESVVVSGIYDSTNKKIVLTLEGGSTIDIPVGDLVSGLQSEITSTNKLLSDLVDDSSSMNKFVTSAEKTTWNNKSDFSGNYNDLNNTPNIPSALSDLTEDSTHRLVSDTEKSTWDSKLEPSDLIDYVKNIDYATASKGGVIKLNRSINGVYLDNGVLIPEVANYENYLLKGNYEFISKGTLENVITGKQLINKTYVDDLVGNISTALDLINGEVI